ncbi:MAG: type II toxin-antitoxin system Phd/YefM family antitoxin [Gemmatimonadaceae bacterium]
MIPKSITPTDLRANLYAVVREVASKGQRYLVTPNEGESVVICSREEYNALVAERALLRDLREAEADVAAGRTHSIAEVRGFMSQQRSKPRRPRGRRSA